MEILLTQAADVLHKHGYKLTRPRRVILEWFYRAGEYTTPQKLHQSLVGTKQGIGLTSVYRNLEILAEVGLVRQVCFHDGCQRYEPVFADDHHHHLICSDCGAVVKFGGCELDELERRLESETGYKINRHMLQVFGVCERCRKESLRGKGTI